MLGGRTAGTVTLGSVGWHDEAERSGAALLPWAVCGGVTGQG